MVTKKNGRRKLEEIRDEKLEFLEQFQLIVGVDLAQEKHFGHILGAERGRTLDTFPLSCGKVDTG